MKAKVVSLSISGKNNKIFRSTNNDVVTEKDLPEGAFAAYLKDGAIELIKEEPKTEVKTEVKAHVEEPNKQTKSVKK